MKVRNLSKGQFRGHKFIVCALTLLLLFVFLPNGRSEAGPYEKYVSSLPKGSEPVPRECFEQAMKEGQFNIYDWAEWWPEEMYENFSKEFGIKIVRDNFADYDELVTKYKLNPKLAYDFTLPDPRAFKQLELLGVVGELNHDWIPNVNKYLREDIKSSKFDPGYKHTVIVYLSLNGYAINTRFVDEKDPRLGSWAYLFEAPKDLKDHGRLTVKSDMFQVIGCALKYLGYSYNSDDEKELIKAKEVLMRLKPWIMAFDSWPKRLYLEEETWVSGPYSTGDFLALSEDVPTLKAYLPKEGTVIRGACMTIPKATPHPAAAHLWFNYVFRPDVNLALIKRTGRSASHTAVPAFLPEKARKWPGVEPPEGYLEKCEFVEPRAYTGKGLKLRTAIWEDLKK